ncbi:MAG: response regulator [Flavisolibacter sp.]
MSHSLTILIADDDVEDLELIEDAIMRHEPSTSLHKLNNGKSVIEFLKNKADNDLPCLIMLDYNMPELTGLQVLSMLNSQVRYHHIPKIILSTSSTPIHIHECINKGASEYFVKPNNLKELDALMLKILGYCR